MPVSEYDEVLDMERSFIPVPYKMEFYDRQSLEEIKKCISHNFYQDTSTIHEHLVFLEHLADKLRNAASNTHSGESATLLRKQVAEINEVHNTLYSMLNYLKANAS